MKVIWSLAFVALVSLMAFGYFDDPVYPLIDSILENPSEFVGEQVEYIGTIYNITVSGFAFENKIWVHSHDHSHTTFGYTSFAGTVNDDATITASEVWNHHYSHFIFPVSIFGMILVLIIFFREWKFRGGRFRCRTG